MANRAALSIILLSLRRWGSGGIRAASGNLSPGAPDLDNQRRDDFSVFWDRVQKTVTVLGTLFPK